MAVYTGNSDIDGGLAAIDLVHEVLGIMAKRFRADVPAEAQTNLAIRAQLIKAQNMIMADLERRYLRNSHPHLVRPEIGA